MDTCPRDCEELCHSIYTKVKPTNKNEILDVLSRDFKPYNSTQFITSSPLKCTDIPHELYGTYNNS